ncbi:MAG: UvrD-helicase domain-containing protein, partial [Lentisphaeria bacterium]|nr:UvrD-helicase domain-containing protein [Lentisphaeria bacterium]
MCSKDEQSPYLKCDISPGQCAVLEAAAGTGKTYNITNIVARIIMERADVTIDKMVIVTFTRAAAGELKFRISQRLAALEKESVVPDTQDELLLLAQQKGIDRAEIRKRLRLALLNFDRAMIGTIHSFAMRSLSENSFSSRLKFEFTLNESAPRIISELCNDFYRSICYENNIFKTCIKKDDLEKYCLKLIADPEIKIVWPEDISDTDITELLKQLKNKDQELINPPYGRKKALQTERGKIIAGIKKVIFERAYDDISKKYHAMCSEENFLGNDDLILKMCDALEDKNLVKQLQQTFPAGLIDEFQDTNNTQFKIFEKIFVDNPDSTFIVVGDPKQAIYRFRNCDIQTYIKAINLMKEKRNAQDFSMDINRRSGAKYIEVLNKIFESDNSFAMDGIKMPLQSAVADSKVLLEPDGQKEIDYPIQAAVDMEMPVDDIYYQCAADIYDFLNKKYLLPLDPPRPVAAGDIAILVNGAWKNAEKLRNALQKFNIPARRMKNANVFNTPEAVQLVSFLEGVLNYNDNDTLLRALITPLSDIALNAIKSEKIVAQRAGWMQELNELWHKRSFMIMFNELLIRFNVPDRLEDRSMSSFNTIADILGEEEFTRKLTPLALLNSLQKHISKA